MTSASLQNDISVVIPTFNRAAMLRRALDSLARQSISRDRYEVIVADDGSTDDTRQVCEQMAASLRITCVSIGHGGISAAKNAGLRTAAAPIVLFFDDDDIADVNLLGEHLRTHGKYPGEEVAVLGITTWHPSLTVTPFMEWLTDVGQFLLAYQGLADGSTLPYTYFWGGRTSCKVSLLSKHGTFDERFRFAEDIELAYRLSRHGLSVVFNKRAASYMIRPIGVDAHLKRCERAGEALALFSRMHPDPAVAEYCKAMGATLPWDGDTLDAQTRRIAQLESEMDALQDPAAGQDRLWELWDLYWWALRGTTARAFTRAGGGPVEDGSAAADVDARQRLDSARHRRAGEMMVEVRALRRSVADRDQRIVTLQAKYEQDVRERDAATVALQAELQRKVGEGNAVIQGLQEELQAKIGDRDRTILGLSTQLDQRVAECNDVIQGLQGELQAKVGDRDQTIVALRTQLDQKVGECNDVIRSLQEELHTKVGDRDQTIVALRAELFEKVEERDVEIRRLQRELENRQQT